MLVGLRRCLAVCCAEWLIWLVLPVALFAMPAAAAEFDGRDCAELERPSNPDTYDYTGWRCHELVIDAEDGSYRVRLRWNRPRQSNRAVVLWLAGGNGSKPHSAIDRPSATAADGRSLRQRLDQDDAIRSIEVQFIDPVDDDLELVSGGGYWAAPRRGYLRPAAAYLGLVERLRSAEFDLTGGGWLTQIGSSNGATLIAFALAYLDGQRYFDRVVMVSGPFLVDFDGECNDPNNYAYMGLNAARPDRVTPARIRQIMSFVNGWDDCTAEELDFTRRSVLGLDAQTAYGKTEIAVVMGEQDNFEPWLLRSNEGWYNRVDARRLTREVLADVTHDALTESPVSREPIYRALRAAPSIAEGLFLLDGAAIYYSDGSHYCYFPNMSRYFDLTGRTDVDGVADLPLIPSNMMDDGICGQPADDPGLFTVARAAIYYSNGSEYCWFPTMTLYAELTGRTTIEGLADFPQLPGDQVDAGPCRH